MRRASLEEGSHRTPVLSLFPCHSHIPHLVSSQELSCVQVQRGNAPQVTWHREVEKAKLRSFQPKPSVKRVVLVLSPLPCFRSQRAPRRGLGVRTPFTTQQKENVLSLAVLKAPGKQRANPLPPLLGLHRGKANTIRMAASGQGWRPPATTSLDGRLPASPILC